MSIVVTPWPPFHLLDQSTRSCRPAVADIPRVLAGNAALYSGHTVGGDFVDGSPSGAPRMGHGTRGHDHSGGDGGAPLFRTVSSVALHDGSWADEDKRTVTTGGAQLFTSTQNPGTTSPKIPRPAPSPHFWIPPCASDETGAYHQLYLRMTARIWGALDAADEVILSWRNLTPGLGGPGTEVSLTMTGGAGIKSLISATPMRCLPGRPNQAQLSTQFITAAGGVARTARVQIADISVGIAE